MRPLPLCFVPFLGKCKSLAAFLRVPADVPMVRAAESMFYESRPMHVAPLHPRGAGGADNSLSLDCGAESASANLASSPHNPSPRARGIIAGSNNSNTQSLDGGAGEKGESTAKKASKLSARRGSGGGVGVVQRGGPADEPRRKTSSRPCAKAGHDSPENGSCRGGGNGTRTQSANGGEQLSREHVTYMATTLTLRRA